MSAREAAALGVADLFRQRARAQPEAPALDDGTTCLSYAQLDF